MQAPLTSAFKRMPLCELPLIHLNVGRGTNNREGRGCLACNFAILTRGELQDCRPDRSPVEIETSARTLSAVVFAHI